MPPRPECPAWRLCLGGCDKKFRSRNAANRVCPKCERARREQHLPRTASPTIYVGGTSHTLASDD